MLKLFFVDYCEDKVLPAENARIASKDEILHSMDCVLHMPANFIGIIDEADVTIQFMVNEDMTVHVDVPDPGAGGSYVKTATLDECLQLVRDIGEVVEVGSIPGLKFEPW